MRSHLPVLPSDTPLSALPLPVQSAIRLSAAGHPYREIAQKLDKDPDTIALWTKGYPLANDEAVRELVDPSLTLLPLLPKALSRYHSIIEDSKREDLALKAARDILLQAYGRPKQRVHIEERRRITIEFVPWEGLPTPQAGSGP